MNDNDIIKALGCCMQNVLGCRDSCPMIDKEPMEWDECQRDIMGKALGLINRQKAKIEALQMDNAQLQSDIVNANMNLGHAQAEIERLEAENDKQYEQAKADILGNMSDGGTSCHWCIEQHKAKAIREFAERIEPKLANNTDISAVGYQSVIAIIDGLVKEMTEGE